MSSCKASKCSSCNASKCSSCKASLLIIVSAMSIALTACTKNMALQDKPVVMHEDASVPDRRSDRPEPAHSIAQSQNSSAKETLSNEDLQASLHAGQRLFEIYCSECHDRAGTGGGMITRRGFPRSVPLSDVGRAAHTQASIRRVILNGKGVMPNFSTRLTSIETDRITRYVRALQFAKNVPRAWLNQDDLRHLQSASAGTNR